MGEEPDHRKVWVVPVQGADAGALVQEPPALEPQQKTLGAEARKESERGKGQFKIRDLLADTRCSEPVLAFLCTTDVGGGSRSRLRTTTRGARRRSGNSRGGDKEKSRGGGRPRNYVTGETNIRCFSPRPPSWRPRKGIGGGGKFPL